MRLDNSFGKCSQHGYSGVDMVESNPWGQKSGPGPSRVLSMQSAATASGVSSCIKLDLTIPLGCLTGTFIWGLTFHFKSAYPPFFPISANGSNFHTLAKARNLKVPPTELNLMNILHAQWPFPLISRADLVKNLTPYTEYSTDDCLPGIYYTHTCIWFPREGINIPVGAEAGWSGKFNLGVPEMPHVHLRQKWNIT